MKFSFVLAFVALAFVAVNAKILFDRSVFPPTYNKLDRANPLEKVTFIVALKQQNLDVLDKKFNAVSDPISPEYRNFMTPDQILDIVAPNKEDHDAVVAWIKSHGARKIISFRDAIEVHTNVAVAEKIFNTKFFHYQHKETGKKYTRVFGQYSVPEHVAPFVHMVSGLSEFPVPHLRLHDAAPDASEGIVPQTIQSMYGTPDSYSAQSNQSQGVIEFEQQYFSPADLQTFAKDFDLTITPVAADHIVGKNDGGSPGDEAELDIQYIAGVALDLPNWFWIEGGTTWLYGYTTHFFNAATVPYVVSISYGWSENDQCEQGIGAGECALLGVDSTGYVLRVNTEFQKIGLRGVSVFVASGDSGANGRTDPDCTLSPYKTLPDYPAASPYVTSVGATQVNSPVSKLPKDPPACTGKGYSCVSNGTEVAVSYAHASFASGGGFSNVAATQSWQQAAVSAYLASGVPLPKTGEFNATGRGYPDIAGFGSDVLIIDGGLEPVGGTSCSSPIVAGVFSLLNDYAIKATGKPLGFVNPLIYQMAAQCPECFQDITVGDNKCTEDGCSPSCKGFECTKGWDPVTGNGSPNYPNMLAYVQKLFETRAEMYGQA